VCFIWRLAANDVSIGKTGKQGAKVAPNKKHLMSDNA
jgi:hypothetical protein